MGNRTRGRLPDVITIGAQKCGTTSLHYCLQEHPDIGVCPLKHTKYFAIGPNPVGGLEGNWHRGLDWYRSQWPSDSPTVVEGFALGYCDWPAETGVPERIQSVVPEAKFIFMARNPVDRAVSNWINEYSMSIEHRPVEEALLDNLDDYRLNKYVRRGLYAMQLSRYRQCFDDPSRYLIITLDDFNTRQRDTLREVFTFLGVDPNFWSSRFNVVRNASSIKRRNTTIGMWIQRNFGDRIYPDLRGKHRHWFAKCVYGPLSRRIPRPALSIRTRRRLQDRFADDIREFSELAGRSFEHWLE